MGLNRTDLEKQARADREYFEQMGASAKNALISQLRKFWPKADQVWPEKFVYDEAPNSTADESQPS